MKNKKLALFGTLGLVVASGASMASTTFAWFTTNRNATLTFGSATIQNKQADLKVSFLGSENGLSNLGSDNEIILTGLNRVTDISGDGLSFYKPVWSATKTNSGLGPDYIPSTIREVTSADDYYVDMLLKVELLSSVTNPDGFKVYLGAGTKIAPVDADNVHDVYAVEAVRMAIIEYDDATRSNPEVIETYAPSVETSPTYLAANLSQSAYEYAGYELKEADLNSEAFVTETKQADATYQIADLTSESETYIGFRFWIEGTDEEAVKEKALGGMFKVNLDIYALSA